MRQSALLRDPSPVGWWLLVVATIVIGAAWLSLLAFVAAAHPIHGLETLAPEIRTGDHSSPARANGLRSGKSGGGGDTSLEASLGRGTGFRGAGPGG